MVKTHSLPIEAMEGWKLESESPETKQQPIARWSSWRGGWHAGVTPEPAVCRAAAEAPISLTELSDLVQWTTNVPGDGKSSPIVWDDAVYLTMVLDEQLCLASYKLADGSLRWRQPLQQVSGATHNRNGFASATPATDGDLIIVAAADALHAVARDGSTLWRQPLPGQPHHWGAASSPMIFGSVVYHLSDNGSESQLGCYELQSGEPAWIAALDSAGGWSSPAFGLDDAGHLKQVLINGTGSRTGQPGSVLAFSPWNGQLQWSVDGAADISCSTAIVSEALVISSSGKNGPLMAIRRDTGSIAWQSGAGGAQVPTGVAVGSKLFLIADHGKLTCRDLASGDLLWDHRLRGAFSASLVSADNALYASSEDGRLFVIDATADKYQELAAFDVGEPCWATPALLPHTMIVRTEHTLWCIAEQPGPNTSSSTSVQ